MRFESSLIQDAWQLQDWIVNDPYHKDALNPIWWITGQGFLSYKIVDNEGTTMYVRTDVDGDLLRLHTQFAPEDEVNKRRVVDSILWALPKMELLRLHEGLRGLVYRSTSPKLIKFLETQGFKPVGNEDYVRT